MSQAHPHAHYDTLETRDPAVREAALMAALPTQVRAAQATAAYGDILRGVDPTGVHTRAALAQLPVTRKSELLARQHAQRGADAFGGFSTIGWRAQGALRPARRVFRIEGGRSKAEILIAHHDLLRTTSVCGACSSSRP